MYFYLCNIVVLYVSPCLFFIVLLCVTQYVCNSPVRKNDYADYHVVKLKIKSNFKVIHCIAFCTEQEPKVFVEIGENIIDDRRYMSANIMAAFLLANFCAKPNLVERNFKPTTWVKQLPKVDSACFLSFYQNSLIECTLQYKSHKCKIEIL